MEKFTPFEKLSKKKQRELNSKKRGSWYGMNPVTRMPENSKAYNRRTARKWSDDSMTVPFSILNYPRIPVTVKARRPKQAKEKEV